MDAPDVSVVLPTRNRRELLSRALRSALAQTVPLEVVVVDEGSTDGTGPWLDGLGEERVRVVRHDVPHGVAAARDAGLAAARGRWVAFLDDDDLWAPDKLEAQLAALAAAPGARWCVGGAVSIDEHGRLLRADDAPAEPDVADLLLASNRIPGGASGVVAELDLVRQVGGFDRRFSLCADWDLWIRLALRSPIASVHRPLVAYRVHAAGMSHDSSAYRAECRALAAKHADERARRGVAPDERRADLWGAMLDERSGRRVAAARTYLTWAWRDRSRRHLSDAAVALTAPRAATRRRDRAKAAEIPAAWVAEVQSWLPGALT